MNLSYLKGKNAIITGASSGIGRCTAIALARAGANVFLVARNSSKLKQVQEEIKPFNVAAHTVCADISVPADTKRMVAQALALMGTVDILVCSAGVYFRKLAADQSIDDIRRIMEVNFFGSLNCIYGLLPHFLERKSGHIVVVSSVDGKKGLPLDSAYVSSKFALTGFADSLRQELTGSGIHVCTVFPGRIDTPMIAHLRVPEISRKISPEGVSEAIVSALIKRRKEVLVPFLSSKFYVVASSMSCGFGDWAVRRFKLQGTDTVPYEDKTDEGRS